MTDLITALMAATGPSRELDAWIWRETHPRQIGFVLAPEGEGTPRYTESIDAILKLLPEGWIWQITMSPFSPPSYAARLTSLTEGPPEIRTRDAPTPALALCIAIIEAKEAE